MALQAELIFDLYQAGFSVFSLDHRGQGSSGRLTLKDRQATTSDSLFTNMVDLHHYVKKIVRPVAGNRSLVAIGDSMGGAVLSLLLEIKPHLFDRAVLTAPMIQVRPPRVLSRLSEDTFLEFARMQIGTGHGDDYMGNKFNWILHDAGPYYRREFKAESKYTHGYERWVAKSQLLEKFPHLQMGGPTYHWVESAILATRFARKNASAIQIPLQIIAADDDRLTDRTALPAFCAAAKDCRLDVITGSRHALWSESDHYRDQVLQLTVDFLKTR
jgi:lysophospholipase